MLTSKSDLLLSPTIDLESFGALLPQRELFVGAVAKLKYSSRFSGPSGEGDGEAWQNPTLTVKSECSASTM